MVKKRGQPEQHIHPGSTDFEEEIEKGLLQEATPVRTRPPLYEVMLLNDDFTPFDYVISVVETHFYKSHQEATAIAHQIHTEGQAVCGIYTKEVAETKTMEVVKLSQANHYPLQCIVRRKES